MGRIFVPSSGPGDWRCLLAEPATQWRRGWSARTLAHAWEDVEGFPLEISAVLSQSEALVGLEPLLIFPEWKVPLPGGRRASQNDVWVLAKNSRGLVSIAVEGKVNEPFDTTLADWKKDASEGKKERLSYLTSMLGLPTEPPDHIHYQLLHRTASAVIEAERFGATQAVMLVHTFSPTDQWFPQYAEFAEFFGIAAEAGKLGTATLKRGIPLHLGWVHGDERFLRT